MDASEKPVIRFKGFSDEWEQHKLGECFSERVESFPDGELLSVTINGGVKRFCELGRNDNSNDDKSKYKKVCIGDIAYNSMRMWQGASGYSPYEGIVSPAYTVLSPNPGINSRCIAYQFKLPAILRAFQVNSQGITSDNWNLKYPSLSKIAVHISENEKEQRLIAKFFSHVDTFITIYRRKYEKLQALKASMLEKMFPKDGTDEPEVRFKRFTGVWERHKVGDFLTESRIIGHTGQDAKKLTVKLWGKGVVEKMDIFGGSVHTQYYIRKRGQFMYGKLDFLHAAFGIVPPHLDGYESTLDSPAFDLSNIDSQFLMNTVTQENFYLKNGIIANGSRKAKRIHVDTFLEMDILMPPIEEQVKIGNYFLQLDNLISYVQQELDKLQSIKKALLEKMFV